ncbi:serine/arginine-rich splicing factor RSZ21 isoform X2 [Prunus yedoensis var. nudiflora]|uniref:Serine/arginine-rich splicing factor RSZ21 isoform X2 n=1 Tax=Prunus yedoensis var. nudiflora TaxID=2094558 RepID=A0A314ZI38_PRUYE|nr:serine/arginine-rich splicing factor RSZ21 isoform X2 [Prunus yedoensis var. nudiflora]
MRLSVLRIFGDGVVCAAREEEQGMGWWEWWGLFELCDFTSKAFNSFPYRSDRSSLKYSSGFSKVESGFATMARVYVGNLDPRVNERDLEDEFRMFGVLRGVWVARRPPGYAFIEFDDRRDALDAIQAVDGLSDTPTPIWVDTIVFL